MSAQISQYPADSVVAKGLKRDLLATMKQMKRETTRANDLQTEIEDVNRKLESAERTNDMSILVELKRMNYAFVKKAEKLMEENEELDESLEVVAERLEDYFKDPAAVELNDEQMLAEWQKEAQEIEQFGLVQPLRAPLHPVLPVALPVAHPVAHPVAPIHSRPVPPLSQAQL